MTKQIESLPSQPSLPPEPSNPPPSDDQEIEEILKERTAELKEKEQREKAEEKKTREVAIEKRKEESLKHVKVGAGHVHPVRRVKARHGKKYIEKAKKIEKGTIYKISEAITLVKELSTTKFDAS